ncbi:MAG: cation:proton antiporter [Leptospiraceae bacterium]|nr:cation:proton antiporter [Leptospiraceae bacterium]
MLEIALFIFSLKVLSLLIQEKLKIPSPITLISGVLIFKFMGLSFLPTTGTDFDQRILFLLPLLIMVDVFSLKFTDLKSNAISLFYVAGISVVLTIALGILTQKILLPDYTLSIPALIVLFCMLAATDPFSVSAVFSNFDLPHKLKVIAEGESLFNDAIAIIIFSIAIGFLGTEAKSFTEISLHSFAVIFGAIVIGLIIGFIGLLLLQTTKDPIIETSIKLLIAYSSFYIAELWHWSGILAIIVSVLFANHLVTGYLEKDQKDIEELEKKGMFNKIENILKLDRAITDKANHEMIIKFIRFIASIGVVFLFISLAEIIDYKQLIKYSKEIIILFIGMTIIRAIMMFKFGFISNRTKKMQDINLRWWSVLTFAGVKGGLSILMVHMIPGSFPYKNTFEAIVIGNIILSTFIYPVILILIVSLNQAKFSEEH